MCEIDIGKLPKLPQSLVIDYLIPIGIIKLQRICRNNIYLKLNGWGKKQCFDCEKCYLVKSNDFNGLIMTSACATSCCVKFVCRFGCKLKCPNGHINKNYNLHIPFDCSKCEQRIYPKIYWLGYSEDEYDNMYN